MRAFVVALVSTLVLAPTVTIAAPAVAGPPASIPRVGDCFQVTDDRLVDSTWWTPAPAVPCTESHNFEVTETGPLPADANIGDYDADRALADAAERCGALDVWTAAGVNVPTAGIIENPVRVEPRSFVVRQGTGSYLCGAVVVRFDGSGAGQPVSLSSALERLSGRVAAALRHCSSAQGGRRVSAPAITVPCTSRPRWQVTAWILWSAFYDAYPGRTALRAHAARLCGPGTVATLPAPGSWTEGARSWCYRLYP